MLNTSRYAIVRRLSRVFVLPVHGETAKNDRMRRRTMKDPSMMRERKICTKENCLTCCKKFTAFMFSRVGLFFVMIGYVALGGWLFQALEAGNEQDMRRSMSEKLNSTLLKLWNEVLRVNSYPYHDKKGNFTLYAAQELEKFEATVIQQVQQGFDGRTKPGADPDWNFFGAILYAVTLVSTIGYGHITTKTVPGKIATVLYSAFGVPLMMLFVANIGSTMAKLFAFVFTRIRLLCCCRWKKKRKRSSLRKILQQDNKVSIAIEEKPTTPIKSSLKRTKTDQERAEKINTVIQEQPSKSHDQLREKQEPSILSPRQLPADVRLDMLTGTSSNMAKSRSSTPTAITTEERSKDALTRINELIRKSSVPDVDYRINDDICNDNDVLIKSTHKNQRQQSNDISSIQYYINETNKLTNDLQNSVYDKPIKKPQRENIIITNLDDINMPQVVPPEKTSVSTTVNGNANIGPVENGNSLNKPSKKELKRSKSESSHNRKKEKKVRNNSELLSPTTKTTHRRLFCRKLKKQSAITEEIDNDSSLEQKPTDVIIPAVTIQPRKSQSFDENLRSFPPPPNYEESTVINLPSLPIVTWKPDNELHSTKTDFDFSTNYDDENFDGGDDDIENGDERMSVPLLVTVFVIPLYLTLGAILFNIWERWGFLNSFYFCFTTLTTIGFGDYVPGASITVRAAKEKLISASLYILLGLVLIAMCFNLMKEQLSQKVKQIASKWGILEL